MSASHPLEAATGRDCARLHARQARLPEPANFPCRSGDRMADVTTVSCRSATVRADTQRMECSSFRLRATVAPIVFEDGLGERLSAVGGANESLEVLKVSNELSAVSTFEDGPPRAGRAPGRFPSRSVRARARRRAAGPAHVHRGRHLRPRARRAPVRGAGHAPSGRVISAGVERRAVPDSPARVPRWRRSTRPTPDSCHGAIAPERIVVTAEGRLVVVEYVLGPALEEMRFSQERYWRELGIALPHTFGLPRFDLFADVTQVGAVALALVLGRRLARRRVPREDRRGRRQRDHAGSESGESEPMPVLLRTWLRSALQLEPRHSFVSAIGAKKDLESRLSHASPRRRARVAALVPDRVCAAVLADRTPRSKPRRRPWRRRRRDGPPRRLHGGHPGCRCRLPLVPVPAAVAPPARAAATACSQAPQPPSPRVAAATAVAGDAVVCDAAYRSPEPPTTVPAVLPPAGVSAALAVRLNRRPSPPARRPEPAATGRGRRQQEGRGRRSRAATECRRRPRRDPSG